MSQNDSKNQNQKPEDLLKQKQAELDAKSKELEKAQEMKDIYEQKLKDLEAKDLELEKALALQKQAELDAKSKEVVEPVIELGKNGKMIGNLDEKGSHPFDPTWNKGVVVRHAELLKSKNGFIEDPDTERLAVYHPDVYDRLVDQKGFAGIKTTVIHDLRKA